MAKYIDRNRIGEILFHYSRMQSDEVKNVLLEVAKGVREMPAADAIEDLTAQLDQANEAIKADTDYIFELSKPHWIPVAERLPKDGEFVLVCNDDGHMMIAKYETETYEWYYKYTNYDFDIWDNEEQGPVCYWMPLPEPPKESNQ